MIHRKKFYIQLEDENQELLCMYYSFLMSAIQTPKESIYQKWMPLPNKNDAYVLSASKFETKKKLDELISSSKWEPKKKNNFKWYETIVNEDNLIRIIMYDQTIQTPAQALYAKQFKDLAIIHHVGTDQYRIQQISLDNIPNNNNTSNAIKNNNNAMNSNNFQNQSNNLILIKQESNDSTMPMTAISSTISSSHDDALTLPSHLAQNNNHNNPVSKKEQSDNYLQQQYELLQQKINRKKEKNVELKQQIQSSSSEILSLTHAIQNYQEQQDADKKILDTLKQEIEKLKKSLLAQTTDKDSHIDQLKYHLNEREEELIEIKKKLKTNEENTNIIVQEKEILEQQILRTKEENVNLVLQINQHKISYDTLNTKMEKLIKKYDTKKNKFKETISLFKKTEDENLIQKEKLNEEISFFQQQIDKMNYENQQMQIQLQSTINQQEKEFIHSKCIIQLKQEAIDLLPANNNNNNNNNYYPSSIQQFEMDESNTFNHYDESTTAFPSENITSHSRKYRIASNGYAQIAKINYHNNSKLNQHAQHYNSANLSHNHDQSSINESIKHSFKQQTSPSSNKNQGQLPIIKQQIESDNIDNKISQENMIKQENIINNNNNNNNNLLQQMQIKHQQQKQEQIQQQIIIQTLGLNTSLSQTNNSFYSSSCSVGKDINHSRSYQNTEISLRYSLGKEELHNQSFNNNNSMNNNSINNNSINNNSVNNSISFDKICTDSQYDKIREQKEFNQRMIENQKYSASKNITECYNQYQQLLKSTKKEAADNNNSCSSSLNNLDIIVDHESDQSINNINDNNNNINKNIDFNDNQSTNEQHDENYQFNILNNSILSPLRINNTLLDSSIQKSSSSSKKQQQKLSPKDKNNSSKSSSSSAQKNSNSKKKHINKYKLQSAPSKLNKENMIRQQEKITQNKKQKEQYLQNKKWKKELFMKEIIKESQIKPIIGEKAEDEEIKKYNKHKNSFNSIIYASHANNNNNNHNTISLNSFYQAHKSHLYRQIHK